MLPAVDQVPVAYNPGDTPAPGVVDSPDTPALGIGRLAGAGSPPAALGGVGTPAKGNISLQYTHTHYVGPKKALHKMHSAVFLYSKIVW